MSGPQPCRWSYANSMSFAFCVTHSDFHRTFLTPPTVCPTALALRETDATGTEDLCHCQEDHDGECPELVNH